MFLIRSAFWLALLVMILPSDPQEQARLYQTASVALHRAATFCDRNQAICTQAAAHWGVFKDKLAVGARMAADLVNERLAGAQQPATGLSLPSLPVRATAPSLPAIDTLGGSDRLPPWRAEARARS